MHVGGGATVAINFARFQRQAINFALCLPALSTVCCCRTRVFHQLDYLSGLFGILKVGTYGYTVRLRERACMRV